MPRKSQVDKVKVSDRMFVFQPCVGNNKYPGVISGIMQALPRLDIEPVTSDEQTCCGGFLTFTNVAQPTSTMPAVARNLAIAEEMNLDTITMCNGCYTFLTEFAHFMNERPPVKGVVNTILSMIGREYKGSQDIYHAIEVFYKIKDRIRERVVRPLAGLKFATHYGCHYLNGFKNTAIDDAFMPTALEEIIEACGGEVVSYGEARTCCGTGLTQVILHKEELSLPHSKLKFDSLNAVNPDAVVVQCPYCLAQLDRMQHKLNSRKVANYHVPVLHVNQLIALALGADVSTLALDAHAISFRDFLQKLPPMAETPKPKAQTPKQEAEVAVG
ncbi:MAG: CoB--CoM heterodisulfide reductase iron-sulfur subunit B family protein [bacterium]